MELYELVGDPNRSKTFFCVWDRDAVLGLDAPEAVTVIFGHTPTVRFQEGKPLEIFRRGRLIGIDCSAGWSEEYGGRLACVRLDDMKL